MVLPRNSTSNVSDRSPLQLTLGKLPPARWRPLLPSPVQLDLGTLVAKSLFDRVYAKLQDEPEAVDSAMVELMSGLGSLRSASTQDMWEDVLQEAAAHPLRTLIHQDPFSARSFHKPRGYAGDAVLIDYIYSRNCRHSESDDVSPLGDRIFRFNRETPACAAVRARRDLVASVIDEVCALIDHPNILSVACGHLREATLCRSVLADQAGRFIALDQDEQSLEIVQREVAGHGVVPVCNSIKSLFRGEVAREQFDFIYSTGLYDYLDDRIAMKLTARLFDMLNPGGRLLVANFLPDIWGAGYMESFMDWKLIYRTPEQIDALASFIGPSETVGRRVYTEKNQNIVFLDMVRR
jgi:SAM-dependent methyltransferase